MAYAIRILTGFQWRDCHSIDTPKADYSPDGSRRGREAANAYVALYFGAGPRFNGGMPVLTRRRHGETMQREICFFPIWRPSPF